MNRFEKRRLKRKVYKNINPILYTVIFVMASLITLFAALGRNDDTQYVDQSQLLATATESIGVDNEESVKVAAKDESQTEITETMTVEETTVEETTVEESTSQSKVKVTADTLLVRSEQSQDAEILGMADEDDVFNVIAVYDEWIQIEFEGNEGYVSAEYVEVINE